MLRAAQGCSAVPCLLRGHVHGTVAAVGVVELLVAVARCLQLGGGGGPGGLVGEPLFEGAVVAFDFAVGLRVVRARVNEPGTGPGDERAELRAALRRGRAECHSVVGQHDCRYSVVGERSADGGDGSGGGLGVADVRRDEGAGAVVENFEDGGFPAAGEYDFGGVDLIAVTGPGVLEPAIGRFGSLLGLRGHQAVAGEDVVDGRSGRDLPAYAGPIMFGGNLGQLVADVVGTVGAAQFAAERDDAGFDGVGGACRARAGPAGVEFPPAPFSDPGGVTVGGTAGEPVIGAEA